MYDTARRVALVKQQVRENTRRKQRRGIYGLSAACKANITEHGIRENIDIKIVFHRIEVFLVSGEDEGVVGLSIDTQRHAEHFILIFVAPRLCRRKVAAVDPHIRRQQTAGVGDKGTV